MKKWLSVNNILMYSAHTESKSFVAERLMKTLKGKIYKKMTAIDSKSSLDYLNELVNEYNDTYHCSFSKKPTYDDYSSFTEDI